MNLNNTNILSSAVRIWHRIFRKLGRSIAPVLLPLLPGSSLDWGPPRRFSSSINEWFLTSDQSSSSKYSYVISSIEFTNLPATHVENTLPINLRSPAHNSVSAQFVAELSGGRVVGADPTIITKDDHVLLDLSLYFSPYCFDVFFSSRLPELVISNKPVLVLAGLPGSNYGHWLHQMLPRLHLAELAGWKPSDFDKVVINNFPTHLADETLLMAGFCPKQLVKADKLLHLQGSPLIVPSIPQAGVTPAWISNFLRETYTKSQGSCKKRIFASRKNARWRKILNESELYPLLSEFGFEILELEKLSFYETIVLFQNTGVVCGLHGANLSNIPFCAPGSTLIEIYNPQHPEIYYWTLASGAKLNYAFILGEGPCKNFPDLSPKAVANHTDLSVNPEKLREIFIRLNL